MLTNAVKIPRSDVAMDSVLPMVAVPPLLCLFCNGVGKIIDARGKTCDMASLTEIPVYFTSPNFEASKLTRNTTA